MIITKEGTLSCRRYPPSEIPHIYIDNELIDLVMIEAFYLIKSESNLATVKMNDEEVQAVTGKRFRLTLEEI